MERIAFLLAGTGRPVFWRDIILCMGVAAAVFLLLALRLADRQPVFPALLLIPAAGAASLYAGRALHWYCCPESYGSFRAAVGDLAAGGLSLIGVIAGTLAVCLLFRAVRLIRDLPALLDELAAAGSLGIAAGRMCELFGDGDRGKMIFSRAALHRLPFAAAAVNPVSGEAEWRFASFCFQSMAAGAIFLLLMLRRLRRAARREEDPGGDFWLFLALYSLSEILLDSTRYDALFLRSNGFVSLEQIAGLAAAVLMMAAFSVPVLRRGGAGRLCGACWTLFAGGFGLVGYMEYYVQRHGEAYVFAYSLMAAGLLSAFIGLWTVRRCARRLPAGAPTEG